MGDHPGPGDDFRQAAGRLILMDIAGLHPDDMDLLDPSRVDHGPVRFGQDAAFEQQHPMVVVGNQ
jgi:hypothetical protein